MSVFSGPEIVNDGLVLNLDAANPRSYPGSGTTWTDLSGRDNHSTLTNGPTLQNYGANAIKLDGINDYIFVPYSNTLPEIDLITISMFYRVSNVVSNKRILHKGVLTSNNLEYYMNIQSTLTSITFGCSTNGSSSVDAFKNTNFPFSFSTNSWYNIVVTKSSNSVKIYVNTILIGEDIISPYPMFNGDNPIYLGTRPQIDFMDDGGWGNFMMYNRALSAAEISQNFEAMRGRYGI